MWEQFLPISRFGGGGGGWYLKYHESKALLTIVFDGGQNNTFQLYWHMPYNTFTSEKYEGLRGPRPSLDKI